MTWPRAILHVDMDAFFASVEQHDHPELRGKPVLVGGGVRGVVCAASYEARPFGCRSAMPMGQAKRLCPQAVIVKPRHGRYREVSEQVFTILESFSPLVEPISFDEGFIDITGSIALRGDPVTQAISVRKLVSDQLRLTCSVGVAPNKFLAKLASDMNKPDGMMVLGPRAEDIQSVLDTLDVGRMWGVGPATLAQLHSAGIRTFADLRERSLDDLIGRFGSTGERFHRLCRGQDDRPVVPDREAKSIGHEETFDENIPDPELLRSILSAQVEHVARRLRRHALGARSLSLKIRLPDFTTQSRSTTFDDATDLTSELSAAAISLLDGWLNSRAARAGGQFTAVRLLGVHLGGLGPTAATTRLFVPQSDRKQAAVDKACDAIATKFGAAAIRRAASRPDK
jgi:DNA polymerase-4